MGVVVPAPFGVSSEPVRGDPRTNEGTADVLSVEPFLAGWHSRAVSGDGRRCDGCRGRSLPETFHAACVTDGGVLIVATYESQEVADRFIQGTLMPLMPIQGGLVGPPEERAGQNLT